MCERDLHFTIDSHFPIVRKITPKVCVSPGSSRRSCVLTWGPCWASHSSWWVCFCAGRETQRAAPDAREGAYLTTHYFRLHFLEVCCLLRPVYSIMCVRITSVYVCVVLFWHFFFGACFSERNVRSEPYEFSLRPNRVPVSRPAQIQSLWVNSIQAHRMRDATRNATQANRTCWCEWGCPHCMQATSKEKHWNLHAHCVPVLCGLGLSYTAVATSLGNTQQLKSTFVFKPCCSLKQWGLFESLCCCPCCRRPPPPPPPTGRTAAWPPHEKGTRSSQNSRAVVAPNRLHTSQLLSSACKGNWKPGWSDLHKEGRAAELEQKGSVKPFRSFWRLYNRVPACSQVFISCHTLKERKCMEWYLSQLRTWDKNSCFRLRALSICLGTRCFGRASRVSLDPPIHMCSFFTDALVLQWHRGCGNRLSETGLQSEWCQLCAQQNQVHPVAVHLPAFHTCRNKPDGKIIFISLFCVFVFMVCNKWSSRKAYSHQAP